MGISKVEINNADGTKNVLVDLTGDTVTADMLAKGVTAHGADGENITGVVEEIKSNSTLACSKSFADSSGVVIGKSTDVSTREESLTTTYKAKKDALIRKGCSLTAYVGFDKFGDAIASDVASGKTFTSIAGLKVTGTAEAGIDTSDATATAIDICYNKTAYVNGEKIIGDLRDAGNIVFSTFSKIKDYPSSNCIYVCGTKSSDGKSVCTNTTLGEAKAPYSEFGDAIAEDVAKGKTFTSADGFKVIGTAEATASNDNCEAYHITDKSTALNFKRTDGDIKVWGYGFKSSGMYQKTTYAFCGDGYYTGMSYGTPTKTSVTWGLNSDGTLSGLPSGLTTVDLLVTKGI